MRPAAVGFHCPGCVSEARTTNRQPRTLFGAALTPSGGIGTKVIMGILAAVWAVDLLTRGWLSFQLVLINQGVAYGQFWRLVTYGFTSGSLLGVALNLLVLWLVGRALESEMGTWRFIALYVVCGIGGATLCFVLGPDNLIAVGASAAIIGLLAANTIGKYKAHEDIRGDVGLLGLLILYNVFIGFASFGWIGMIGSAVVGAIAGVILAYAPRQNKTVIQVVGLLGVVLACLIAVVAKIAIG